MGEVSRIRDAGEARIRNSREAARARDPREAFRGDLRAGGGVPNESLEQLASSTRRERGSQKNQESSATAGAETAAPGGSGPGQAASSPKRAIPAAVVDRIEGRSGAKGVSPESVEATHQSPSEGADCEVAPGRTRSPSLPPGYRKGRVHGAEQAPSLDRAQEATATGSVGIACEKGVHRDQALKGSHDGELDSFRSIGWDMEEVPETAPAPSEAPRSRQSSGLTGAERVTSETIIRIGATPEGEVVAKKQDIKPGTAFFMKRRPQEKVKFTSQVRSLMRPADNSALSMTDASTSEWMSETAQNEDPPVLELTEENLKRLDESVQHFDPTDQSQISVYRPTAATRAAARVATTGQAATCSAAKAAASSISDGDTYDTGDRQAGGSSRAEDTTGSRTEDATDQQAQSEESTANRRAESGSGREFGSESPRSAQESREGYRDPQEREGILGVGLRCEHLTDDQRAHLFRTELSSEREAEAIEWEKELACREKEEEERRKAKALYRSEKMAQALEHGKEIQRRR